MKHSYLKVVASALALVGALSVASVAQAARFPSTHDKLCVFDPTGAVFACASATLGDKDADPTQIFFINIPGLTNDAQFGNPTNIFDPANPTYFSDLFGVADLGLGYNVLAFNSDSTFGPAVFAPAGPIQIPSTIGVYGPEIYDATMYLNTALTGFTAKYIIPEPTSLVLLGTGLIGLARSRKRKAA